MSEDEYGGKCGDAPAAKPSSSIQDLAPSRRDNLEEDRTAFSGGSITADPNATKEEGEGEFTTADIERLGAEFFGRVNHGKNSEYLVYSDSLVGNNKNFLGHFLHRLSFYKVEPFVKEH